MIVHLSSGETVEIAVVTRTEHLIWAYGACSGMHSMYADAECSLCGLFVREGEAWRRMTSGERAWLKHRDDWMQYV